MNLLQNILHLISDDSSELSGLTTFINPFAYYVLRRDQVDLSVFDHVCIDGIFLIKLFKLLRVANVKRTSFDMTSYAPWLFTNCISQNKSVYIVATKQESLELAYTNIKSLYPKLNIIGMRNGYFSSQHELATFQNELCASDPDIVIVGMGAGKQEAFLSGLHERGWRGDGYTCGGFMHQIASSSKYYPEIVDELNVRWLYRMYDEPKLMSRYFIIYPYALIMLLYDFISLKLAKNR